MKASVCKRDRDSRTEVPPVLRWDNRRMPWPNEYFELDLWTKKRDVETTGFLKSPGPRDGIE